MDNSIPILPRINSYPLLRYTVTKLKCKKNYLYIACIQFSRIFKLFTFKFQARSSRIFPVCTKVWIGNAGKSGTSGAFRSSPAERSLRSSGCLQTLITSANVGPFLNRDDANIYIYIYRRVPTPYSWTTPSSRSTPTSLLSLSSSFLLDFLPTETVPADLPASGVPPDGNPMETYLSGCPDDAKSNFVSQEGWGRAREPPVKSAPRER